MKDSAYNGFGGTKTGLAIFAALIALVVYIFWVGAAGEPIPRWILWLATIF